MICKELNLTYVNTPVPGVPQAQNFAPGTSQAQYQPQASATGVSQQHVSAPGFSQSQNGADSENFQAKGTDVGADAAHVATDTAARSQIFQDQSTQYHFREMQRRQVEFVKKRVLLLEKGLNAELQKVHYVSPFKYSRPVIAVIQNYYRLVCA